MAQNRKEYIVSDIDDFPTGSHRVVTIGNREIGVFNVEGQFYALPNLCPHQLGPLCRGRVCGTLKASAASNWKPKWVYDGEIITCPWHGLEYHIPTGQCVAFPEIRLRTYEVFVDDGQIKIRI